MSTTNPPVKGATTGVPPASLGEIKSYAEVFAKSGLFPGVHRWEQAAVIIMAGAEIGLPPCQSMKAIHIVKGNTTVAGHVIAARIRSSGRYDYRIAEHTDTQCLIEFYQSGQMLGRHVYTMAEAKRAGNANGMYDKCPKAMLFNRAISSGYKLYCPDALNGALVYTPDEFDAEINIAGAGVPVEPPPPPPTEEPKGKKKNARVQAWEAEYNRALEHCVKAGQEAEEVERRLKADWKEIAAKNGSPDGSLKPMSQEQFERALNSWRQRIDVEYLGEVPPADSAKAGHVPTGEAFAAIQAGWDADTNAVYDEAYAKAKDADKTDAEAHEIAFRATSAS